MAKTRNYGINTRPAHTAIIYSVPPCFASNAYWKSAFFFFFSPFFLLLFSDAASEAKHKFKSIIMCSLNIKTYRPGSKSPEHSFFVLCKGENSGRPAWQPCPNCFVVSAATRPELERLYWLTYAMWRGRAFHIILRGSVIPFISIREYRHHLQAASIATPPQEVTRTLQTLNALDAKEEATLAILKNLKELKALILTQLLK